MTNIRTKVGVIETPELDKLRGISDSSQAIGEFMEWLGSIGIHLAVTHEHEEGCTDKNGFRTCGYMAKGLEWCHRSTRSLLAEYFNIDENKCEAERRALLKAIREEG